MKNKLTKIFTSQPSKWHGEAAYRQKNKEWLAHSQAVARKILRTLRKRGITQKDLAACLDVSPRLVNKWVKGGENLTLETIAKLEVALTTGLITVPGVTAENF